MSEPTDHAPGWAAIDAACARAHPDQPDPLHWAPQVPPGAGDDALYGVSVYRAEAPLPHWHFVTYGLSDLFGEEPSDDPEARSGAGFELTFRLLDAAATDPGTMPPLWPVSLLGNLARYVARTGHGFAAGHHLDTRGPIKLDDPTALRAISFISDPQLGTISTESGHLEFLQVVGLTIAEAQAGASWKMDRLLELLLEHCPLGITDLARGDLMADEEFAAQVAAGIARDGSGSGALFISHLRTATAAEDVIIEVGALGVPELLRLLPLRIGFDRDLIVQSTDTLVLIRPGAPHARHGSHGVELYIDDEYLDELVQTLKPERGDYRFGELDYLVWRVVPSELRDADGNVVDQIG